MCLQLYIPKHSDIAKSTPSQNSKSYTVFSVFYFQNLLSQCGDIEKNPGLEYSSLSFCHCNNLNGLAAHDCIKITLMQAYMTDQNFDVACLSETFLHPSIQNDDIS